MSVLIMRHGEAQAGTPDPSRELSEHGREEARRIGCWLAHQLPAERRARLTLVVSPFTRAQQTAQEISSALELSGEQQTTLEIITPDDPLTPVLDWLQTHVPPTSEGREPRDWLIISHNPLVSNLASALVDGPGSTQLAFATASLAWLDADVWAAGLADLHQFVSPAELT
ncbi:phosphohistidine phosphatase SixA [Cobetia sp. MB87]|uniref:phosphohistidine phosphatase SixA n=1 Tax=Cobetia sp. MB87 TaxID=2588451 RepID=UPI00140B1840|nr:phosphohistidine phosphatase SixA [Cobetia sp. MB87]NHH86485.1 Phosphohistidine phosphatase SixA [Cobetia sp. MB87]